MKLTGNSTAAPPELRRVSGVAGGVAPGTVEDAADAANAAHANAAHANADGATPVPRRLKRLAAVVDRSRRGRTDRNLRKIMQQLGMLAIGFGFVCIILGWYGAAHSPYCYQEIPYVISGGLLGLALVIGGGVLVRSAWNLRQIEEDRRNALAIVRSVDRLERILRTLGDERDGNVERGPNDRQLQEQT